MRPLPIRIRLTLWYFVMFASAAALLSVASLWMLERSLDATEYHDMQERAEDVQEVLLHDTPDKSIQQLNDEFTAIYAFKDDGKYLQVRDAQGNWIFRSRRMIVQNPDLPAPDRLPKAGQIAEFHQGTRYVRILAYPITVKGRQYSVQTGIALNKSMVLLQNFRTNLLWLTPVVILLAALGGHLMSRKALQPVAALAAEARRINDRNLDIRLPVQRVSDEISDLVLAAIVVLPLAWAAWDSAWRVSVLWIFRLAARLPSSMKGKTRIQVVTLPPVIPTTPPHCMLGGITSANILVVMHGQVHCLRLFAH